MSVTVGTVGCRWMVTTRGRPSSSCTTIYTPWLGMCYESQTISFPNNSPPVILATSDNSLPVFFPPGPLLSCHFSHHGQFHSCLFSTPDISLPELSGYHVLLHNMPGTGLMGFRLSGFFFLKTFL